MNELENIISNKDDFYEEEVKLLESMILEELKDSPDPEMSFCFFELLKRKIEISLAKNDLDQARKEVRKAKKLLIYHKEDKISFFMDTLLFRQIL